jgi:VWFA-related protein
VKQRIAVALGAWLAGGQLAVGGATQQQPVFRAATDVVTIDVSVSNRNRPIAGLTVDDFDLLDNGVPQTIEVLTLDTIPVDVTLLFEVSSFMQQTVGPTITGRLGKIADHLRPADRLRVITFATEVREVLSMQSLSDSPSDVSASEALTKRLRTGWSDHRGFDRSNDPRFRRSSLFDALLLALAKPAELGRRHLVIGFGGADAGSVLSDGAVLAAAAARADAVLHMRFGIIEQGGVRLLSLRGRYTLATIAEAASATGGGAVEERGNAVNAVESILDDFRRSYLLQYTATGVAPGGWHTVDVRTPRHPDADVRARIGYLGRR